MKIIVMVGTNPYSFDRMLRPVDELAGEQGWDVFMQIGNTPYKPVNCENVPFIERGKLISYIKDADLVITHGGFGSIKDALDQGKPVIAVPRNPEQNESQDRQVEMVREMEREGYLIGLYDMEQLKSAIDKARGFRPVVRKHSQIPGLIKGYFESEGLL